MLDPALSGPPGVSPGVHAPGGAPPADRLAAAHLAALVESSEDAIISRSLAGIILTWNQGATWLYGYTATEALGQSCLELLVPAHLQAEEAHALARVAGGERVRPFETVRLRQGGLPVEVSVSVSPVVDGSGVVVAASSISRDVGERNRTQAALRASEARHRAILDTAMDCIISIDGEGRVLDFNPAAERTFGYPRAQALGRLLHELIIPEELHGAHLAGMARHRATGEARMLGRRLEMPARRADGTRLLVELAIVRVPLPGPVLFTAHLRDVTERRQMEELRLAKEAAERANLAKGEFLSRMSHELRTPLNAILGFGQLLEMDVDDVGQRDSVTHILKAGRHLLGLIDEVLDLSRIESGHLAVVAEAVALDVLVLETLGLMAPLAAKRGITLTAAGPPPGDAGLPNHAPGAWPRVRADERLLRQVLLNLVANAVKYNVAGGRVTLDHVVAAGGDRLRVRVADTGPGFTAAQRARLFAPFERLGAERGEVEGSGLGLSLAKAMMEAMGGHLGLEEEAAAGDATRAANPGAVFWLELPRA